MIRFSKWEVYIQCLFFFLQSAREWISQDLLVSIIYRCTCKDSTCICCYAVTLFTYVESWVSSLCILLVHARCCVHLVSEGAVVGLSVCLFVTQHLTSRMFSSHKWYYLLNGQWRSVLLCSFLRKCSVAKLKRSQHCTASRLVGHFYSAGTRKLHYNNVAIDAATGHETFTIHQQEKPWLGLCYQLVVPHMRSSPRVCTLVCLCVNLSELLLGSISTLGYVCTWVSCYYEISTLGLLQYLTGSHGG